MIRFKVIDAADQQFAVILNNRRVTIRLWYNFSTDRWSFDLSIDDRPVIRGRRIVEGVDLLAAFPNIKLGKLFAHSPTGAAPNRSNLPAGIVNLYHVTDEEVDAVL